MQPSLEDRKRLICEMANIAGLQVVEPRESKDWPVPMAPEAFIGLAGDFVRLIEPHTEADPAALLGSFIVAAGVMFGRDSWAEADGKEHWPVEFLLIVGETGAGGRKGTARARTMPVMGRVEEGFDKKHIIRGPSSAEGLIKRISQKEKEIIIPAPTRTYLLELPEFASMLAMMKREGNALSPVLRQAWDGDRLCVLTRKDPLEADDVNLSVIADVTPMELLGGVTAVDRANGFLNRFLPILVRRSKCLPEGGGDVNLNPIVTRLHSAVEAARGRGLLKRDAAARDMWADAYGRLTRTREGMVGALCARAEAHTLRLSLLYALLDQAQSIRSEHLLAALAFWDYCERSIHHVFAGATADVDGEKIIRRLAETGPATVTELHRLFANNRSTDWIMAKMAALERSGKVENVTKQGDKKGALTAWDIPKKRGPNVS